MRSPLTNKQNCRLVTIIPADSICKSWQTQFGIDISQEWREINTIFLYECVDTKLRFFKPSSTVGSALVYGELQQFDWYYMPRKWEHDIALQDINNGQRVLEVGCGFGDFIERIYSEKQADIKGIELNEAAVRKAQTLHRPVFHCTIEEIAATEPNAYDVICHFEVLEHVMDPLQFLQDCIRCLKPGGRLLIAVPNMESFIRHASDNLLNQPPHHMTHWFPATFRALQDILPLRLIRIVYEPLASYHIDWYINTQAQRLPNIKYIQSVSMRFLHQFIQPMLNRGIYRFVRGHTQYVVFEKVM